MRESVRRELVIWAQYLAVGSLATLGALSWHVGSVNRGSGPPVRWADLMPEIMGSWLTTYLVPWLVLFTVFSLIRIVILFFLTVKARDREQTISRRSW